MRSRSGNPLATLMLTLPLLAIPLMAVFGVPQFVPVIASSVSEAKLERSVPRRSAGVGESALPISHMSEKSSHDRDRSGDERLDNIFLVTERPRPESQPARRSQLVQPASFGERSSLTATTAVIENAESKRDRNLSDLFGTGNVTDDFVSLRARDQMEFRTRPPTAASLPIQRIVAPLDASAESLTWRQAVRRLNELGIQQFRLEPGHDRGDFYFACEFSPDNDPRIKRRFEAEAPEPLQAVELVLGQIDDWTSRR